MKDVMLEFAIVVFHHYFKENNVKLIRYIVYPPKTNAKMQRNLDYFFKPKKRISPVPDHNLPLSQTQGSDSSLQS